MHWIVLFVAWKFTPFLPLSLFLTLNPRPLFLFLSHLSRYFLPILCLSFFLTYLPTRPISMLAAVSRPQIIADTMLCRHVYDRHVSCPKIAFVSALISSCPISFSSFPRVLITSRLYETPRASLHFIYIHQFGEKFDKDKDEINESITLKYGSISDVAALV